MNTTKLGLQGQAAAVAQNKISSAELVAAALDRIQELQPKLNAFRVVIHEQAAARAAQLDNQLEQAKRDGRLAEFLSDKPLFGVPIAIKDDTDLQGQETRFGCAGVFETKSQNAFFVEKLLTAGAVIVGKTTTPELGQYPITENIDTGATRNPWSPAHSPGGSSGGSAAAVASGMVPAAVGSDGAGSVRIPAAWSHLVGIKPQRGRISTWPDAEAFNGLTVHGPLARTVGDAALLLDSITGNHPNELHKPPAPQGSFFAASQRNPGRLRIGVALNTPFVAAPSKLDNQNRRAVLKLAEDLQQLEHHVEETQIKYGPIGPLFMPRSMTGIESWTHRLQRPEMLDQRTRKNAKLGKALRPLLPTARAFEKVLQQRIGSIYRQFDVLIAPTTASTPLPIGSIDGCSNWRTDQIVAASCPYSFPWNVLGWPGINVPAGFTNEGLPVGVTLLGNEGSEPLLISLAAQLEEALQWQNHWPEIAV